jgi:hypothetical protein
LGSGDRGNLYRALTAVQLGAGSLSTILGGVRELVQSHLYPICRAGILLQHYGAAAEDRRPHHLPLRTAEKLSVLPKSFSANVRQAVAPTADQLLH